MTKIAAFLSRDRAASATAMAMLQAQSLRPWQAPRVFERDGVALGYCVASPRKDTATRFVREHQDGSLLLVSGVPIAPGESVDSVLDEACTGHRPELLARLDGAFAALYWDAARRRLTAVSDFLGLQPFYTASDGSSVLLASELKGIAAARGGVAMDAAGWGAFIAMGHCLGDHTMAAGVRRVPAASVVSWDTQPRKVCEHQYWGWRATHSGADAGDVIRTLEDEVREYARYSRPGTVLLSGGFDSRLILAVLRKAGLDPDALSIRHPGERLDADGRYASAAALALGVPCKSVSPPALFFRSGEYLEYLSMHEVANPTMGLFIPQVSPFIRPELGAVWEGVAPGYALAFPRIGRPDLREYLRGRCQPAGAATQQAAALVFRNAGEMRHAFELLLAEEAERCGDGDAGLLRFEARHQMRHRMAHNPLKVYSNDVPCFTPGTSREFWSAAASIPYSEKWNFRFYFDLFRRYFPEALSLPFCSMGRLWSDRFRPEISYHLARLFPPPGARSAVQCLRRAGFGGGTPWMVRRVMERVDPGHPDLRPDAVARLKSPGGGEIARQARLLLFHWQVWRWVLEGRMKQMCRELAGDAA